MPRPFDYLKKLIPVFSDLIFLATFYGLTVSSKEVSFRGYGVWFGLCALSVFLFMVLLERGVSLNLYLGAIALSALILGGWVQLYLTFAEPSLGERLFFVALSVVPVLHGANMAYEGVEKKTFISYFDGAVLISCLAILTSQNTNVGFGKTTLCLCLLDVLALLGMIIALRMENEEGGGRKLYGPGLALLLLLAVGGLVFFSSLKLEVVSTEFVDLVTKVVFAILRSLFHLLCLILDFLASLFPADAGEVPPAEFGKEMTIDLKEKELPAGDPLLALILLGVLLTGGILFVLWKLRGIRLGGKRLRKTGRSVRKTSHLSSGLKKFLLSLWERFVFHTKCVLHRNSPTGLLLWTEHNCLLQGRRKKAETPRAYLQRISTPETVALTEELTVLLEKQYYGGIPEKLPEGFASRYRRGMRKKA